MNSCAFVLLIVLIGAIHVAEAGYTIMIYHCLDFMKKVVRPFIGKHTKNKFAFIVHVNSAEQ